MHHSGLMIRLFIAASLFLLVGCSDKKKASEPEPAAAPTEAPAAQGSAAGESAQAGDSAPMSPAALEANHTFKTLCATCHGESGKGDGTAAASLNPKPRDYTDKEWQAAVTDEELAKIILEGGAAVGKSALMPPNPQFKDKPEVIAELVKIVRSFGK